MANVLANGILWLNTKRATHLSDSVQYTRSGYAPLILPATRGQTTYQVTDESGLVVEAVAIDFLIAAASLVFGGQRLNPEIGDEIVLTESDGAIRTFEVLDLGGTGHYRKSDILGTTVRVHTKLVNEVFP